MGFSKGKKKLSSMFGLKAMSKRGKPSSLAKTIEPKSAGFREIEVLGFPLDDLKHLTDPSPTDSGDVTLSHQVSFSLDGNDDKDPSKNVSAMSPSVFRSGNNSMVSPRSKLVARSRMQIDNFKKKQFDILKRLKKDHARKVGIDTMFDLLTKLGKEAGEREYNAKVLLCIERTRRSNDAEYALDQTGKAIELLKEMKELGFAIEERTYDLFFKYLVDMEMVEEFQIFMEFIREVVPDSVGKLVYYEMLLWIQVGDEEKIYKLCNTIDDSGISLSVIQEYYLAALCEKDRKENLQKLLEIVDVTKVSSADVLKNIFGYLGKSLLESVAMKLFWELRDCDGAETVSDLIFSYATCIPDSTVENVILKFKKLHGELDIMPSSTSYEKLVSYLCGSNEVVSALDLVENMCEEGLVISANILHSLLHAVEQILEFNLVQRIYSIMSNKSVEPNTETFRRSINLCIRIKDFEGAYNMLGSLKNFNLAPNCTMYNSILAGYFREKKVNRALMVLKEMKEADVKPDSMTFSYLINYCDQEEAIAEYYEEMKQAGLQAHKHVYMSLIKAYASCGQSEKAKQVLTEVLPKDRDELKSVLISALAANGKIIDAISIYEEMKKAGCPVDPKAIISLIDNSDSNEELTTLVQHAHELRDYKWWIDGFFKIIVFAVRNNKSSSILDLLKQTRNLWSKDDIAVEYWFEEVFRSIAETENNDVKLGLDLVSFMKEELELCPSRKCLDFLLHACVNAKDKQNALLVWKEYQFAELPYNVLNYLRMYQILVAAGDLKSAEAMVLKIPNDDRDVKCVIEESRNVFTPKLKKKKSKSKNETI